MAPPRLNHCNANVQRTGPKLPSKVRLQINYVLTERKSFSTARRTLCARDQSVCAESTAVPAALHDRCSRRRAPPAHDVLHGSLSPANCVVFAPAPAFAVYTHRAREPSSNGAARIVRLPTRLFITRDHYALTNGVFYEAVMLIASPAAN